MLINRFVILCIIDILTVFWIAWDESFIQYEPPYDFSIPEPLPLPPYHFNIMIFTFIVNTIVVISESWKKYKRIFIKYDLIIAFTYFTVTIVCMLLGTWYIMPRSHFPVLYEDNIMNILFAFPIWLFGKEAFARVVTVTNLYISLCVIHTCMVLFYIYLCVCGCSRNSQGTE